MKILKWIIGIVMAFVLLTGVSLLMTSISINKMHPTQASQLEVVNVAIKSISLPSGGPGMEVLAPQGYFTKFIVVHAPVVAGIDAASLTGQRADVYLSKSDAAMVKKRMLGLPQSMVVYGIVLNNGTALADPAVILAHNRAGAMSYGYMLMIVVPVAYYLLLFFFGGAPEPKKGASAPKP